MKLSLITISSLIVLASAITQAEAADLPSKAVAPAAPVVVAPVFTWTGFYVGGELGWGQTRNKYTPGASVAGATTVVALPTLSKDGVLGGLFAGYNYQINQIVIGGELDGSFLIVGKERYTAVTGDQITAHTEWTGSARARLGYAVDHWLLYGTGGLAFASAKSTVTGTGYSYGAGSDTRWGWTLGAGVEYAFTSHWIAGLEYRYTQYESDTYTYPVGVNNLGIVGFKQELSTNQVTARLSYKF